MEQQLHLLTGAYALNAVAGSERTAFEKFALANEQTRDEVRSLSETAALLAYGTPAQTPPPELKAGIMAAIANTRQVPPSAVVRDLATAGHSAERSTARPRLSGAPHRRWTQALAAAAALLLVAGVGLGGWAVGQGSDRQGLEQQLAATQAQQVQQAAMLAIMAAPDAKISTAKVGAGTVVTVASSGQANQAAILVKDMPAAPAGKSYELWFISAQGAVPAGLMATSDAAASVQLLEGPLDGATHIGITVEPAGGSPQPTTTPILLQPV